MKVVITGVTSFTGAWLANGLLANGHEVIGVHHALHPPIAQRFRIPGIMPEIRFQQCSGNAELKALVDKECPDHLIFHGLTTQSETPELYTDYIEQTLLKDLREVLKSCRRNEIAVTYSSSIFESRRGVRDKELPVNLYALAKSIEREAIEFYAEELEVDLATFVITNPFGKYEEKRFLYALFKAMLRGETFSIGNPFAIRDNVQIEIISQHYVNLVERKSGYSNMSVSQLKMSNYALANLFANKLRRRGYSCDLSAKLDFLDENQILVPEESLSVKATLDENILEEYLDFVEEFYVD